MNTHELSSLEALLSCQIKLAERHGLDEIRISIPRAREIMHQAIIGQKRSEIAPKKEPLFFSRLDAIHFTS